jgi:hypothetical protein
MFLVVMTCLSGCNDEVDIYSKNDYLPVIYSLYCPDDSIINIRVGRTFQGDQSAFQSAKEPDTAFIRSLKVSIEFVDINGTYLFARQEIRPVLLPDKEPGLFYRAPNYSFCAKTTFPYQLDPLQTGIMRLIVFDPALNRYSVAESPVLGRTKIVAPRNDLGTLGASLYNNPPFSVKYMDVGAAYEIRVVFYYSEIGVGDMEVRDSVSWNYPVQYENTEVVSYHDAKLTEIPFGGDDFYKNLSRRIRVDHQVNRLFKSFSIHMSVSDPAFRIYQNFLNSGLDIDAHIISNITNGIGFFSVVRRSEVNNIRLDIRSLDSLCNGQFTRNLGFKKW